MSTAAVLAPSLSPSRYPIDELLAAIGDVPWSMDPTDIKRKSRDYFWYSPILADQLSFKHEVDPLGLLNPGKMRSFIPRSPGAPQ